MSKRTLALEIIRDTFGAVVATVAQGIIDTEECTFRALQRTLVLSCGEDEKIPIKKLRQSLLILIKHHLVITEVLPEDVSQATSFSKIEMSGLVYRVDLINVVRRLKYGQMLQYISSHYSNVAEIMVENLMVHGSMTITQLISTMLLDPRVNADEEELKLTFNKLVQDRFVILHPPLEVKTRSQAQAFQTISAAARTVNSILAINSGAGSASSSAAVAAAAAALTADGKKGPVKRGRKAAGVAAASDATSFLPAELRAAAAAASQPAPTPTVAPAAIDESAPAAKKRRIVRGTAAAAAAVSNGGATSVASSGPEAAAPMLSDSVVNPDSRWKVGVEQFLKIQKHKVCVEFIQEQCGGLAEVIAKIVLKQSIQQEVDAHAPRSMTFSLFELQQSLKEHQASTSSGAATIPTDFATLRDVLEVMRHSSIKAILKAGTLEQQEKNDVHSRYVINYEGIFAAVRRRTVHSIAIGRFGQQSARILELLMRNPYLEQQVITDRAILPARETRERLYALFLNGWVSYQELSKRSDFSASSSAFFWYVDHTKLSQVVADHCYKALFNLLIRRQQEISVFQTPILLSKEDEIVHRQHQYRIELLNFAEQQLDQTLVVLEQTL